MRFALTADHRDFYQKQGYIEFEKLLSEKQVEILQQSIETCLSKRLKTVKERSPKGRFEQGFDLWRESPDIKKILFNRPLSEIASQLFQAPLLRIAFDQYCDTEQGDFCPFPHLLSIEEISCAKPLAGALLLALTASGAAPLPSRPGYGVYLNPHKAIDWKALFSQKGARYIAIAYATKNTLYHFEPKDPRTHAWKSLGYVFGDLLKDTTHPIIYRAM